MYKRGIWDGGQKTGEHGRTVTNGEKDSLGGEIDDETNAKIIEGGNEGTKAELTCWAIGSGKKLRRESVWNSQRGRMETKTRISDKQ